MAGILDGKVALVTEGASGIGSATAMAMAREGARVAVSDVSKEGLEATVAFQRGRRPIDRDRRWRRGGASHVVDGGYSAA
jgi:NAD(P)-dependent dehydrogenase (short-subunit alcohol dehydrogenase family)